MNQQQLDQLKADLRQILETRLERPIERINTRLGHIEETLKAHDGRFDDLNNKIAQLEAKLKQFDDRFNEVLAGQRDIRAKLDSKPFYTTDRP